jgi:flagellar protein FliJ
MKRFRYRLEPVLKIKEHHERQRQKEHAAALQQVMNQQSRLEQIETEKQRTFDQERPHLTGSLKPHLLMSASRYLVKLKRDTLMGRELLRGLETEAERRRQRLVEAAREKKTYEKHKEKLERRFAESLEQKEAKLLDEMAIIRYTYRHKS